MTTLTELFIATIFVAGILTLVSIWADRRLFVKGVALIAAALFLPLAYASMVDLMSRPKPIDLEWWRTAAKEATVLGSKIREKKAIDLWLQLPGDDEPRAYVLPWNRDTAEKLQKATQEAQQNGSSVRMRMPFEPSLDDREPKFYAMPQPAMPPKDFLDPPPPQRYAPPERGA